MPPPVPRDLPRRSLLGVVGLAGAAALAGCSAEGWSVRRPGAAASSSGVPSATASPRNLSREVDERIVNRLVPQLDAALARLDASSRRFPALASRLGGLRGSWRADLEVLRDAVGDDSSAPSATTSPAASGASASQEEALTRAVADARSTRKALAAAAGEALSGIFARLLASMSASVAQRLSRLSPVGLPRRPAPVTGRPTPVDPGTPHPFQTALAGEHAAVHVYGVLGAQTSESSQGELFDRLTRDYTWHRTTRDLLEATLRARGQTPVAAAPSYSLPNAVADPAQVTAAARETERRLTTTYGAVVARTVAGDRLWSIGMLEAGALRQLGYGGVPSNFPGTET